MAILSKRIGIPALIFSGFFVGLYAVAHATPRHSVDLKVVNSTTKATVTVNNGVISSGSSAYSGINGQSVVKICVSNNCHTLAVQDPGSTCSGGWVINLSDGNGVVESLCAAPEKDSDPFYRSVDVTLTIKQSDTGYSAVLSPGFSDSSQGKSYFFAISDS